jgi:hypothetical protein
MSKKRDGNLTGGLALIGLGLGWLAGYPWPGLFIGLGVGLLFSALARRPAADTVEPLLQENGQAGHGVAPSAEGSSIEEPQPAPGAAANVTAEEHSRSAPPAAADVEKETEGTAKSARPDVEEVWSRIVRHQNETFRQAKGQEFTYQVIGNAIEPSTTKAKIHKSQFAKALPHAPFAKVSDVPKSVFGPSYVYAILMDPRIRKNDW